MKLRRFALSAAFVAAFSCLATPAQAFRSIDVQSFTDPDYAGYQPKKVVVMVVGGTHEVTAEILERVTVQLAKKGIQAFPARKLFPPTRTWSEADQAAIYEKNEIDSGLIVTVGANASQVIPVATQTYGSANVFGNVNSSGSFNAYGTSSATSYNIMGARSKAEFSAVLLDIKNNRTVWYADVLVKAQGTLFVSEKGDAKGVVNGILEGLEEDGHVSK
jgi:hypothetical protein